MTITRTVNGKEIDCNELYKMQITNPTLEAIFKEVVKRLKGTSANISHSDKTA